MNKNLTTNNEQAVLHLVRDCTAKNRWQAVATYRGKKAADTYISNLKCQPLKTVRAARYYWEMAAA